VKKTVTIKENRDFRRIYQKGRSFVTPQLVVYVRGNHLGSNRLGLTTGVKIGGAVQRNRVRRRLREIYRLNQSRLRQGNDLIIVARTRAVTASYRELEQSFLRAADKLQLKKEML
jgi:ribonuclease P protein component